MICHLSFTMSAQTDPYEGLMEAIWLDSMTITAKKMGFDVNNFIEMVREDTSFYQAFKNLRLISHNANHKQEFFNEKGKPESMPFTAYFNNFSFIQHHNLIGIHNCT